MLVCCDLEQKLASWPLKSSQVKSVVEILRVKSSQVKSRPLCGRRREHARLYMPMRALPLSLRAAARELGRLPEVADARRLLASNDVAGALRNLRRAAQIVEYVPMPPLRLAALGTLAQVLRVKGSSSEEAKTWTGATELCAGAPDDGAATMRLHALSGAATCALHRAEPVAVLGHCAAASSLASTPLWQHTFGLHSALAQLQRGSVLDASATLEELERRQADMPSATDPEGEALAACAEGVQLLRGDALAMAGDTEAARARWTTLLPTPDAPNADAAAASATNGTSAAAKRARALREVAARCRVGRSLLTPGAALDAPLARTHLVRALDVCESELPSEAGLLASTLGELAALFASQGEFVAAEGLYRSALDPLMSGRPTSAAEAAQLLAPAHAFAELLGRLEFNGKPRVSEADRLRALAAALHAVHPEALPAGREWLGLEPWYASTCEVDWLGECAGEL